MLGAAMEEIEHARIFEKILHRLPEGKTLEGWVLTTILAVGN